MSFSIYIEEILKTIKEARFLHFPQTGKTCFKEQEGKNKKTAIKQNKK